MRHGGIVAQSNARTIRVGLLILAGLVILAFGIMSIGMGSRWFTGSETLEAHFHRVNGLQTGAPVRLAGVNIGSVAKIAFDSENPNESLIAVTLWIRESAASHVRADSKAKIQSMGLLGDQYVEITAGHPGSPPAPAGSVLQSRDPIDYQTVLQAKGTGDLVTNVMSVAQGLHTLLEQINQGNGFLGQLIRGQGQGQHQLNAASVRVALDDLNKLTNDLDRTVDSINRGHGVAGALLSSRNNGQQMIANIGATFDTMHHTSEQLGEVATRLNQAHGLVPQLVENEAYGREVMTNLRSSSYDLSQILRKINTGQGTVGKLVNDPTVYYEVSGMLSTSGGWAFSMMHGFYNFFHPFAGPNPPEAPQSVLINLPAATSSTASH
jgi:phospholipid/cholesterol/gamma-HCH transport system substrate-binding protein